MPNEALTSNTPQFGNYTSIILLGAAKKKATTRLLSYYFTYTTLHKGDSKLLSLKG